MPDLVCVGHIVREMIYFPDSVKGPVLGSPPAYCSVAAARQGVSTGVVTRVGPDMPAELLEPFSQAGVDTSGMIAGEVTTASELIYDSLGNKEIRYPARAEPIRSVDVPECYHGCRMIYVCTMDNDVPLDEIPRVVALGQMSAVDLGGYGGVHMSRANRERASSLGDLACSVSSHFDIVKASDEDAISIFGFDDPDLAAQRLLSLGPKVVLITAGARGVFLYTKDSHSRVPPLSTNAIDTTGGGDTFMAGFLGEYMRSGDAATAGRWGSATAACVIERTGGVRAERMPDRDEVARRVGRET